MHCACAILSTVPCPAVQCFSIYLVHGTILKKTLLNIKCVFWFSLQLLSETFLILRRTERHMIISVCRSSCKVPVILVRFNETGILYIDFRRVLKYQISWKSIHLEPSCSMLTGGQTNMTKLNILRKRQKTTSCLRSETNDKQLLFSKTAVTG